MMNNISQISRYALWAIFAFALWLNYVAWQKDYALVDALAQAAAQHPAAANALDAVPGTDASAPPAAASTPGAQAPAALAAPGSLAAVTQGFAGDAVHVRTDVLDLTLSLKGGTFTQVDLPAYAQVKGKAQRVQLENHDSPDTLYVLQAGLTGPAGETRPNQQAIFTADQREYTLAQGQDELRVPLHWSEGGVSVTKEYVFRRGSYAVDIDQTVSNQSASDWPATAYAQILRNHIPVHSSMFNPNPERFAFTGPAIWDGGKYRKLKLSDEEDAHLSQEVTTGWIAALQHHFVTAVVPPKGVPFRFTMQAQGNEFALAASGPVTVVPAGGSVTFPLRVFVGPKLQAQLATSGPQLQRVTDFGHLYFIAQPLFWALSKVYDLSHNWGVAILSVTLLLKLIFYPLSEASGKSMAKMRELGPRIKNLQEQYKDDREKLGRATMELYTKEGANPVSGCLPILVQMPVFFAFYWVLQESVEMRQAPFIGWLQDLSSPDPYFILPILMAGAMFVQQKLNPAPADPVQAKVMLFMPIAMSALFAFLPSGLVLYYVANTVLGVAQQWNINRRIHAAALAKKKI